MNLFTQNKRSEVDIQVAQELKNHKDFVYQTHQALQNLSSNFIALSMQYEKLMKKAENDRVAVIVHFDNLKSLVEEKNKNTEQRMGDVETKISSALDQVKKISEKIAEEYLTLSAFDYAFSGHKLKLSEHESQIEKSKESFHESLKNLKEEMKDAISILKTCLTPKVEERDLVQEKIDESLKAFRVDCQGLAQEIVRLKRNSDYDQKKFENLYTLVHRLQERMP